MEDVGGGDFAGDLGGVVEGFADVLGDAVAGEVGVDGVDGAVDGLEGCGEGCGVAGVGDEEVCLGVVVAVCGLGEQGGETVDALACGCRY